MFEVTEKASGMLKNFLEQQKGAHAVRILIQAA